MRPLAIVASTGIAYSIPGKWKSDVYWATPLTLRGPSTRGVSRPIGETALISCVDAMLGPSLKSGCRCHVQSVREAALGQLNLKFVFALRLSVAQSRLSRFAEI